MEPAKSGEIKRIVTTGNPEVDKKIGGGIPEGSLSLVEGQSDAGKSVLVQQLTYGALTEGFRVVYYTTENTTRSLLRQMDSLSMSVTDHFLLGKLNVYPVPSALTPEQSADVFTRLIEHIARHHNYDIAIMDSLTPFVSNLPEGDTLSFFTNCKQICDRNKTVFITLHSYAFDESMFIRIRSICDAHLRLRTEEVGEQLVKVLQVAKIRGAEKTTGNVVSFDVEPGLGMRIVPITKAKA
ncbi:MAG: ATPase domain-containing protein [Dehalococcoidia bacterium]|nr:ATPase domain-containing protein [Dehalococcoidia bacterium]